MMDCFNTTLETGREIPAGNKITSFYDLRDKVSMDGIINFTYTDIGVIDIIGNIDEDLYLKFSGLIYNILCDKIFEGKEYYIINIENKVQFTFTEDLAEVVDLIYLLSERLDYIRLDNREISTYNKEMFKKSLYEFMTFRRDISRYEREGMLSVVEDVFIWMETKIGYFSFKDVFYKEAQEIIKSKFR